MSVDVREPQSNDVLSLATSHSQERTAQGRDRLGYGLAVLMLCLLPIERLMLPAGLRIADFALLSLTVYGLVKAWHTDQRLRFPLIVPIWLILLSSASATLFGLGYADSLVAIVQEVYLFCWFIALTNLLMTFPLSDLDGLLKIWCVIACIEAVTTFMGMLRIGPSMFYSLPYRDRTITTEFVRSVGTFINPNATAMYLLVSFFALLGTTWSLRVRAGLGTWLLAGMFATGSNGALLSMLIGFVILVVVFSSLQQRYAVLLPLGMILLGTAVLVAMVIIFALPPAVLHTSRPGSGGQLLFLTLGRFSRSLTGRLDLLGMAWKTFGRYPLGIGPNAFYALEASVHNDYAAFLFERGPVGLIGWLLLVGTTLATSWRAAYQRIGNVQRWRVLALGAGFCASAVNALSHEISHMRQVWVLMAFLFALCYVTGTGDRSEKGHQDSQCVQPSRAPQ